MRARRSGAIVQLSSMGGQLSFAGFGAYSATKFALEGGWCPQRTAPSRATRPRRPRPSSPPWTRTTRRCGCRWARTPLTRSWGTWTACAPRSAPGRRSPGTPPSRRAGPRTSPWPPAG
ncbi:SDR family NAD(P)-dependent oxidoreductase [Actinokineospora fastidiosa]|uniref:SDR family NAD(P)-dependent oxidoreductase n=1 Tax=Actinokineospora fastidiosa TaxID=1816 RepID=UPI0027E4FF1F|nr:SDR family NAD(P)-dependent oxidoreductase [Actinokineospora fastidiosa]